MAPVFMPLRPHPSCCWLTTLWLAALLCAAPVALAQDSARDYVEPRLTRAQFSMLCARLSLDSTQRSIAERLFSDYTAETDGLTRRLEEQARAAGLGPVQDAMAGRARLSQDELRALRVAVLRVYQQGWPEIDESLQRLLESISVILTEAQDVHLVPAMRELRRTLFLHSRQGGSEYQEYAGEGVDVLQLVDAARAGEGELSAVNPAALRPILGAYESQLDALLQRQAVEHRNGVLLRRIAGIERDAAALRELDEAALRRWRELYELNLHAVRQIGEAAGQHSGEPAKQRWLERFDHACFPWLFTRKRPDRQIEWMRQQRLAPEVMEQAESLYEEYIARRREMTRQAMDLMLQARLELNAALYFVMERSTIDPVARGLHQELLKASGEQELLDSTTAAALDALLTPAQRDSQRKALHGR